MNKFLLLTAAVIAPFALFDGAWNGLDLAGVLAAVGAVTVTVRRAEQ